MKLSTRSDYAVRVVLELAEAGPAAVLSAGALGERAGVPPKYLLDLLRSLRTKGIVRSQRGPNGGFSLGRPASQISVGEVIRLEDGPLAPIACASRTAHVPCPTTRCESEEMCVLRDLWVEVRDAIAEIVDNTSFAELRDRRERREEAGRTYAI